MSDVNVTIKATLEGLAAFEEAKAGVARIKDAIEAFRAAEAAGAGFDRAMQDSLSDMATKAIQAGATVDAMRDQVVDARKALTTFSEAVANGMPIEEAQTMVLGELAERYRSVSQAAEQATVAQDMATTATVAASSAAGAGAPGWLVWAGVITAVSLALSPFVVLIGSAAVILAAFAVSGAATLALLGGLAVGFAAIGAAVVALGGGGGVGAAAALTTATDRLSAAQETLKEFDAAHTGQLTILQQQTREQDLENIANAQTKYNDALAAAQGPTAVLIAQLTAMKDTLAAQAAPLAAIITQWVGGAIPAITAIGQSFMTWFGDRLHFVLESIGKLLTDLGPTFSAFARFLGAVFDAKIASVGPLIESGIRLAISAVEGLITTLVAMSNWFEVRLPLYGPIVASIFGFIGGVIVGIAQVWGQFADWLANHWPTIVAIAQKAVKDIGDEWAKWYPQLKQINETVLPAMGILLVQIAANSGSLVPVIMLLTVLFLGAALAVMAVVAGVSTLLTALENLKLWVDAHHPTLDWLTNSPAAPAFNPRIGSRPQSFAMGGVVLGPYQGAPVMIQAHAGETVSRAGTSGVGDTSRLEQLLQQLIAAVTAEPSGQTGTEAALWRAMQGAGMNRLRGMAGG